MKYMNRFRLEGRSAIVTAAGNGIGRAIAEALCEAGSRVALLDVDEASGRKAGQELRALGHDCMFLPCNVLEEDACAKAVGAVLESYGKIDVLVNVVGGGKRYVTREMGFAEWKRNLAQNIDGTFLMTRQVVNDAMMPQKSGSIVNMASITSFIANNPDAQTAYNTAKGGILQFTRSVAAEWAKDNIRVNAIAPGFVLSKPVQEVMDQEPETWARWMAFTPVGRAATPDEIACAAVYFASDAASYTTGACLVIDGAYTVW